MMPQEGMVSYAGERIRFRVVYVARKTLEIAVYPDCTVIIKAPNGTLFEEVQKRASRRARWIKRQLEYFGQFTPRMPGKHYVGGETHLYLGRQYRLKVSSGAVNGVKLIRGHLHVTVKDSLSSDATKALLDNWYAEKAADRFKESFDRCWPYFAKLSLSKPRLQVRRMQKRWGSLSKNGTLTLNPDLVRAPRECIDYVVVHELCHLQCHDHGPGFYRLMEKVMPDWETRKHKLELALA